MKRIFPVLICMLLIVGCNAQADVLEEYLPYKPLNDYDPTLVDTPLLDGELLPGRESGIMGITIFGIGRADAILITTENYAMMIDTGENRHGLYIVNALLNQNIIAVDYLIITHFDSDHVGGAHVVIDYLDVRKVIVPNYSRESRHVERFEAAMKNAGLEAHILTETMLLTLDDVNFMINPSQLPYFSFADVDEDADFDATEAAFIPTGDDFSIVVSITHGANNFLFTGDAVAIRLQELLENDEIMSTDYDFLKVPRHGRHNRRSIEFIHAINPRYAVITGFCPTLYNYYYPERPADERVIAALKYTEAAIFFTMSNNVHVRSDGAELFLSQP